MSETPSSLVMPSDLSSCQALLEQQAFTIAELLQQRQQLQQENEALQLEMAELRQRMFRKRRERYLANPDQRKLDFGDADEAADAAEGLAEALVESEQEVSGYRRRRSKKKREDKLPEHLPREEVVVEASAEVRHCEEPGERKRIGDEVTETLQFERPKLTVIVTKYPKYACAGCVRCGVSSPERAARLVEGNRYDSSVAAAVSTGKYGYHLPVYRPQDYFAGSGWLPSRSTLRNLLVASAVLLRPLVEYIREVVLGRGVVGTDDTGVTLLLPKTIPKVIEGDARSARISEVFREALSEGKPSGRARMWAYRSMTVPLQSFDFTVSRHREGPDLYLQDFKGKLLADCYAGYEGIALASGGVIERGACVAHARRKVYDGREAYPLESSLLLSQFQQRYDIEARAKVLSVEERVAWRQAESAPVWQAMGEWLESEVAEGVLPKSPLASALGYLRNHWDALRLYLSDGRLPIDNNEGEQLMKQVASGRKNWLFVGSVAAGARAADILTVVSSVVGNDLDVWAYVKDVLDELLAGSTDYESLRPDIWKQSHPEAIRTDRTQERRDRADRQQRRRSQRRASKQR